MDKKLQTIRRIKIISVKSRGFSYDESGTIDGNPDRDQITFEPLNCTKKEFLDWYLLSHLGEGLCSDGKVLIDLGGSGIHFKAGQILEVTFDEYFRLSLERNVWSALNDIRYAVSQAHKKIALEH